MTNHDEDIYTSKRLILPPKINVEEPERIIAILRENIALLENVISVSDRKPRQALRQHMVALSTIAQVADAATKEGIKAWLDVGLPKSELMRLTGKKRTYVDRSLDNDPGEDLKNAIDAAEDRGKKLREERDEDSSHGSSAAKNAVSANPYDDSDYEQL